MDHTLDIEHNENSLFTFTAVYMALLDTNNPTQEQLDLLAEHQFIKEPMQLVKPEAFVLKGNTITERSGFLYYLSKQITKSLDRKLSAFNSPYQIDKKLGIEFETGLTQKWPMNTTVALVKMTEDEHHVGYMAISSHEQTAAIIKDKATGKAEIYLHGRTRNQDLTLFITDIEFYSNNNQTREGVYVNKSIAEKNAVFEVKTGYPSLNDFFKAKFPKETSEIENFGKVIDRLVNKATITSVSGLKSGDVTADNLQLAAQLQNLILKIYNSDSVNVHEAAAVEDLFTFNSDKHAKDLASCFNIDTTAIRQLPSETMNKLDIEPLETSFFQTVDNTLFVVSQNGINMYKPDEAIQELHGMNNDEHTFQIARMMYVGQSTVTIAFDNKQPEAESNQDHKENVVVEIKQHLETLNEFIEEHYPAAVIIAPPALAEFVDDMAGYSFVHSNQEFDGVEFVDIWNHYEDYYTRTPTPLLAAVMEDLSENHDTRAYDFETTLERALNMVEGVEPEPEPETPKAKPRNKMKI